MRGEARRPRARGIAAGRRGKAGATPAAALCSAPTGGGRERKEEEEKAPREERIRSCPRDKAECGVEGEVAGDDAWACCMSAGSKMIQRNLARF